jgi:membrane protease YdiL (CAAX protease family)
VKLATRELEAVRAASPLVVAASLAVAVGWLVLLWWWLYPSDVLAPVVAHLGGVVGETFVACLLQLSLQLAVILGLGRLSLRDVGVTPRGVLGGLAIAFWVWLAVQVVLLAGALINGDPVALDPHVDRLHLRMLVDQVAGNAPAEEIVFRGFLLVQCVLIAQRVLGPRKRTAWVAGLVLSQTFFALTHIPQRWMIMHMHGSALVENLAWTAEAGVIYALIYLRTGMLGIAIAYHALDNLPFALVDSPLDPHALYQVAFLALLVAWPRLRRR